jgi:hypothetical protein
MGLPERLAALTPADLVPVVRRVLDDERAHPQSWSVSAPGWSSYSPSTRGVFRVDGTATTGTGGAASWTAVLKVVGACDYPGHAELPDANYWKREPLALASGLLEQRRAPLVPVPVLASVEVAADEVWLWLECLDRADTKPRWDDADRLAAASDLGTFSAVWAVDPPTGAEHPWLAQRWLRGWLDYAAFLGGRHALEDISCWRHPQVAAVLPASTRARYVDLMAGAPDLLARLEGLPVTLAHHDAQWRNLFLRPGSTGPGRTVALDWAFTGLAPVGADLGHMIACDLEHGAAPATEAAGYDAAVTAAYLRGLATHGWSGDEREVRFARATSAALQLVPLLVAQVAWLGGEPAGFWVEELGNWPAVRAAEEGSTVDEVFHSWALVLDHLLRLGDEARALAGSPV